VTDVGSADTVAIESISPSVCTLLPGWKRNAVDILELSR